MRRSRVTGFAFGAACVGAALVVGAFLAAGAAPPGQASGSAVSVTPSGTPYNPKVYAAEHDPTPSRASAPVRWRAGSVAEVTANLPTDANFAATIYGLSSGVDADPRALGHAVTLGSPLFVRGLAAGDANEYLVPVNVGHTTIAILEVRVDTQGLGSLDAVRGWSITSSFPAISEAAALARASAPEDRAVSAELVWTEIRGQSEPLQPFWRLRRASGAAYFLFENGMLVSARDLGF